MATLKRGDQGENVKALQSALKNAGYDLSVDGVFGQETDNIVKRYQQDNQLGNDGIVSEDLWSKITGSSSSGNTTAPSGATTTPGKTTADALAELIKKFQDSANSYTPKSEQDLLDRAKNEYQSYYDQLRQAAQQQQERNDLSLSQQKDALQATYDKQREQIQKEYNKAYSQTDRQMLSHGMQRSSYGAQTLANLSAEGAKAQGDISDAQTKAANDIAAQRAQLEQQLAGTLAGYDTSQAADVLKRYQELQDKEYDRQQSANSTQNEILAKIYEYTRQQEQDALAKEQWEKQFAESKRQFDVKNPTSTNSGGIHPDTTPEPPQGTDPGGKTYDDWMNALNSGIIPTPAWKTVKSNSKQFSFSTTTKPKINTKLTNKK